MAKKTDAERLAFLNDLELPPVDHRLRRTLLAPVAPKGPVIEDQKKDGFLDDGALVSFVGGVSAQHQSDVLNSFLLAQLAANKKFDREAAPQDWYRLYHDVLENIGWVVQNRHFEKYEAHGDTMTVQKAVLELLAAIAGGAATGGASAVAVITETLNALKALSDSDGRVVLWDSATHSVHTGNFQVGAAVESGGQVAVRLGSFYFTSTDTVTKFLWFGFSSSNMNLMKNGQIITLNEGAFAAARLAIADKLGDHIPHYVADIDI